MCGFVRPLPVLGFCHKAGHHAAGMSVAESSPESVGSLRRWTHRLGSKAGVSRSLRSAVILLTGHFSRSNRGHLQFGPFITASGKKGSKNRRTPRLRPPALALPDHRCAEPGIIGTGPADPGHAPVALSSNSRNPLVSLTNPVGFVHPVKSTGLLVSFFLKNFECISMYFHIFFKAPLDCNQPVV